MNFYLLFALAFGAVTGVAEVRIARVAPVSSAVTVSAERLAPFTVRRSPFTAERVRGERRTVNGEREVVTPLTGAATPRAPSQNC